MAETSLETSARSARPPLDELVVIHDVNFHSAALNMAIDEALLQSSTVPLVRFYRWDHPAVSFGYFGRFAELAPYHDRDLVRRWTGGGIVFHGRDLTYALIIPVKHPLLDESAAVIYEHVHRAMQRALLGAGVNAELASSAVARGPDVNQKDPVVGHQRYQDQCFANPVRADVMVEQQKIAGAAQRRTRRGLLQQGSIQAVELPRDFEMAFAGQLARVCDQQCLSGKMIDRAGDLARSKYATDQWLRKR